jgi:hypothetical protein
MRIELSSRFLPALAASLALAACNHGGQGTADSGTPTQIIPTQSLDGGVSDGGVPDAGGKTDAGAFNFDDGGPVTVMVTAISPDRGSIGGGTAVTLSGSGFLSGLLSDPNQAATVTSVTFGGNPVLNVSVLTDGTIQVSSPPGLAGVTDVTVTNPNGSGTCKGCFDYQSAIEIAQVSPGQGPTSGGTSVVVTGIGFDAQTTILFGPLSLIHPQFVSSTTFTGLTPPSALAGPVDVRAFNTNGAALLHGAFDYFARPTVGSVSPPSGPTTGGTPATLTGSGFLGEQVSVSFGGETATGVSVVDDQTLTLTVPAGPAGPVDVVVSDANGTATLAGGYVYYPAGSSQLSVLGVAPPSGPAAGGTIATVVGTGFSGTPTVELGTAAATATLLDPNDIQITTPPGSVGAVAVSVTVGGATVVLANGFTYYAGITVSQVTPPSGPSAGGTSITVVGTGFSNGDRLFVGALEATSVQVTSAAALTATTPPGTAGPANVQVLSGSNPTVFGLLPSGYTYQDPFGLVQVSPASGAQAGGTYVTLLGSGFGLGVGATFGGNAATNVELVDAYTVACDTPPGTPGPVDVTASQPVSGSSTPATSTLPGGFSYFNPTNIAGGESGGPIDGTLNVTVLDSDYTAPDQPLQGTLVTLGDDPRTPFQGYTDANGQITFSDPSLVKAQTVTADYEGYVAATVDDVDSQNLTIFLDVPMGSGTLPPSCPCGAPPDCPDNCGLPYCGAFGSCVQCLADSDCKNPSIPGYDPTKPKCNPPGGLGGFCVQCLTDSDCTGIAGDPACDNNRGAESTFSCVACTSDKYCANGDYCNLNSLTCVAPDVISGSVQGFRLPPSVTLTATQDVEAHVGLLQEAVYAFEPFNVAPPEVVVPVNGGTFTVTLDEGPITIGLYAKFGVEDSSTTPPTFTPYLLGVLRAITVTPGTPVTNANIILSTHLDQTAPITLSNTLSPPAPLPGVTDPNPVNYDTYAYLDLGQDGILPLGDLDGTTATETLGGLPPVSGDGVLFLTQAFQPPASGQTPFSDPSQREPASFFFRNVSGDFTTGVPMGPLLSFANFTHPAFGGQLDGTFTWAFADPTAPAPDLSQLNLYWTTEDATTGTQTAGLTQLWQIVVPGTQTSVTIPPAQLSAMLQALPASSSTSLTVVEWELETSTEPRFDYDYWSYSELSVLTWTGFQITASATAL